LPPNLSVTKGPLPASKKVYKPGTIHPDIRVPMRETTLHPTSGEPPVTVYDASGPCTVEGANIRIEEGLPRPRRASARRSTTAYDTSFGFS